MDEEAQFRKALEKDPKNRSVRLIFADWLEDQGRKEEADKLRNRIKTVEDLVGRVLISVRQEEDEIIFAFREGEVIRRFRLYHEQNCCEHVSIEDICGNLEDLVATPLLMAQEAISRENPPEVVAKCKETCTETEEDFDDKIVTKHVDGCPLRRYQESFTWTFYKFATVNGYVTIRWYGCSNGYYSERVEFGEVGKSRWDDEED